ncbi:hypothetical protein P3X46_020996 [Hevea brasiliensis]|uniref:BRI1 kinase inhibitor 1 n=1 Tax=Hevea brasiliensis TaxID=3981 RepID=A0ABQ9LF90_HEVBR|nr:BRI1 kinase inhibitor 1 [Hevea brasiliensis]KAJ9166215.1 hypothetical protein P3X46_020996 [Hevea brasiliensis]
METIQHRDTREKFVDKHEDSKLKQEGKGELPAAKQLLPTISPASPPSASSSPSHEFSFTISLHSSSTPVPDKAKAPPPSFAIDLSPADDIFFHGHLLPLHLLSHLPVSPRSSTNSLDSFTLPIRELLDDKKSNRSNNNPSTSHGNSSNIRNNNNSSSNKTNQHQSSNWETKARSKPKPFSLFSWRKGCEVRKSEDKEKQKKKLRFEVSHILKRYVRMVRPLLFFKGRKQNPRIHRQTYSFSGNLSLRNKQELRGERGEFSAPASMRTSPTNSGLLVATAALPSPTSDSTMEELQAAIQAAIAHCKNSIAAEEKIKC